MSLLLSLPTNSSPPIPARTLFKLGMNRDEARNEVLVYCPPELRLSFPQENNKSLKKIAKLEDPYKYSKLGLKPRRADLDMNQHVNNVAYIGWVLESIPQNITDSYELQAITLDYRRECQQDDIVDSLTSPEQAEETDALLKGTNGNGSAITTDRDDESGMQFLHLLRLSGDRHEINRGRTEWRKKTSR